MPNISLVIPEVDQTIFRPIIVDIVKQIQHITYIPDNTKILFPSENERVLNPGSAISDTQQDRTQFLSNNYVEITVEEDHRKDALSSTANKQAEHLPIFHDEKIGVFVKPVYSTVDVVISFKFRAASWSAAKRWRDDIRMRTSMGRDINLHDITYHYNVPGDILTIIKEIHKLRENVAPYNEDFRHYFDTNSTDRATVVANQSGEFYQFAIAEKQMRIVGMFDFEGFPDKGEKDNQNQSTVTTFNYKFSYEKPIGCNIKYPIMVHNQLLPVNLLGMPDSYNLDNHNQSFSLSFGALNAFESQLQHKHISARADNIVIPPHDEFMPRPIIPGSVSIISVLCEILPEQPKLLVNLRELGDIYLDEDILDFISTIEHSYITQPYKSIFLLSLYNSNNLNEHTSVSVSPQLDVVASRDLDLRDLNRIRLSLIADVDFVTPAALTRLKSHPRALYKVALALAESLRNNPGFKDLGNKPTLTEADIRRFINNPNDKFNNYYKLPDNNNNGGNKPGNGTYYPPVNNTDGSRKPGIYVRNHNSVTFPQPKPARITDRPDVWLSLRQAMNIKTNTVQTAFVMKHKT